VKAEDEFKSPIDDQVRLLFRQGKYADSVPVIQEHLRDMPADTPALELLANALKFSGDKPGAAGALIVAADRYAEAGHSVQSISARKKANGMNVTPDTRLARACFATTGDSASEFEEGEELGLDIGADLGLGSPRPAIGIGVAAGASAAEPALPPVMAYEPAAVEPEPPAATLPPPPTPSLPPPSFSAFEIPEAAADTPAEPSFGGFEIPAEAADAPAPALGGFGIPESPPAEEPPPGIGAFELEAPPVPAPAAAAPKPAVLRIPSPLFDPLSDEEFAQLSDRLESREYEEGQVIVAQGGPGDALYVIATGVVSVLVDRGAGQVEVAQIGPGEFFGEAALLTGEPRTATVKALTRVDCLELSRAALDDLVRTRPHVREVMQAAHEFRTDDTIDSLIDSLGP
jgi:hypothetical protein